MTVGTWWSQDAAPWAAAALLEIVLGLAVRASVACRLGVLGVTVVGLRPDVEVLLRHVRHGRLASALTDAVEALAEKLHGLLLGGGCCACSCRSSITSRGDHPGPAPAREYPSGPRLVRG
jgi:hypothetical protein